MAGFMEMSEQKDEFMVSFNGRDVLVTGGLGFIGSSLVRRLVALDAKVTIADNLIPEHGGNRFNIQGVDDRVLVRVVDVRDQGAMRPLLEGKHYLFNLAGQTSHLDSMLDPFADLEINCRAQLAILEVCREVNPGVKVVFASTRQIYGKPEYLPVDEKHLLRPVDVNGINKMAGEWYHILYNNVYGIKGCSLRLTNTYGPGMRIKDARQTFLGIWIKALVEHRPFEVWEGQQLRDLNYVDDVVDAMLLAANDSANGRVFNLGGSQVVNLVQLADELVKANGGGAYRIVEFPKDRKNIDIGDYYADYTQINNVLGWKPLVSLETGLARTLNYYREHLQMYV